MKVYIPVYDHGKRTYDEIDTTSAVYHHWAHGGTTIFYCGLASSPDAIYATPGDALTYGWSRDLNHHANALNPRDLEWKIYHNHVTGERRVSDHFCELMKPTTKTL